MTPEQIGVLSGIMGALGVGVGAFGAHALKQTLAKSNTLKVGRAGVPRD